MKLSILAFGLAGLMATPAYAFVTQDGTARSTSVQDYEDGINSATTRVAMAALLDATIDGFEWTNSALESEHRESVFCMPVNLALTQGEEVAIVNNFIHQKKPNPTLPLGFIALMAMQMTFPCPSSGISQ